MMPPVTQFDLKPSITKIKAFDGTRKDVLGDLDLPVKIGPCVFDLTFQVMDINPTYSCLIGRPWLHSAGAVPSTLHQKVKFIHEDKLITVSSEEELIVQTTPGAYVDAIGGEPTAYQTFEIEEAVQIEKERGIVQISPEVRSWLCTMIKHGYEPGKGLGARLQGRLDPVEIHGKKDRYGLGFDPLKSELSIVKARGPVKFVYGETINNEEVDELAQKIIEVDVTVLEGHKIHRPPRLPRLTKFEMCNWTEEEIPVAPPTSM